MRLERMSHKYFEHGRIENVLNGLYSVTSAVDLLFINRVENEYVNQIVRSLFHCVCVTVSVRVRKESALKLYYTLLYVIIRKNEYVLLQLILENSKFHGDQEKRSTYREVRLFECSCYRESTVELELCIMRSGSYQCCVRIK